ncbi:MAG: DUF2218 domain-containing protein [Rhodospirillaceae bacterium]|nr:DUF2218 domain-containing protein [Rhodospirillaceae bacterium]
MTTSQARVTTAKPKRYMEQLCKHFEHKRPVTRSDEGNSITFSVGVCKLTATDDTLIMDVEANDASDLATLQDVVARHLVRFMFREPVQVTWLDAAT